MGYVGQAPAAKVLTSADIADDAVDSDQIAAGAVDAAHMSVNSIDSDSYVDGSIDNAHLADDAVDSDEIAAGAIDNAHLADNAVDSDELAAGSVDTAHIADNQVTLAKMAGIARGKIIYGDTSGDPAVLASGDAGEVLTMTDGNDFDWAAVAGGSTTDFTSLGSITAGDMVALNDTTGTVSTAASSISGTGVAFGSTYTQPHGCYDLDEDRLVICYRDTANSGYGTVVVGTVSTTSVTFGTPVVFESASTNYMSAAYETSTGKVVITYTDSGDGNRGKAVVVQVTASGNVATVGTPATIDPESSTSTMYTSAVAIPGKVVITYRDGGNSSYITSIVATPAADNSITFGTAVVTESVSGYPKPTGSSYDSTAGKVVISYDNGSATRSVVGTVSGTDISFGTTVTADSGSGGMITNVYDPSANKTVVVVRNAGGGNLGRAFVGTVSGTDISFGTAATWHNYAVGWESQSATYDDNLDKVVITYLSNASAPNGAQGEYIVGTISGTDITFGAALGFTTDTSGSFGWTVPIYDPDAARLLVAFQGTTGKVIHVDTTVDTNYTDWIGIAAATVSTGVACAVNLMGSVNENQSSLTVGSTYYIDNFAAITTTVSASREIGRAVSATKMYITQGSIS